MIPRNAKMWSPSRKNLKSPKTISSHKITTKTKTTFPPNPPIPESTPKMSIDSKAKSTPCLNWAKKSTFLLHTENDSSPKTSLHNNSESATSKKSKSDNNKISCSNVQLWSFVEKNNFLSSENMKLKTKISTLEKENVKLQKLLEE